MIDPRRDQLRCEFKQINSNWFCKVFGRDLLYHNHLGMPVPIHKDSDWHSCAMLRRTVHGWQPMSNREITPAMVTACEEEWAAWISDQIMK